MELEERLVKLEAESAVQNALIRALVEMLPPPHPMQDAPLLLAMRLINETSVTLPEPKQSALQAAMQAMNPLSMPRRRS